MRIVYGLALRQTEGFLQSISTLLDLGLRIPDRTTLSRCSEHLNVRVPVSAKDRPLHIMIDSTGLRVHSGNSPSSGPLPKRRAWRKLHLVVDAGTGDLRASALTTHRARDAAQVAGLLPQIVISLYRSWPMVLTTQRPFMMRLMPMARTHRPGFRFHLDETHRPAAARTVSRANAMRPFESLRRSVADSGRMTRDIRDAVWSRPRCPDTKRSSAIRCGVALWHRRRLRRHLHVRS